MMKINRKTVLAVLAAAVAAAGPLGLAQAKEKAAEKGNPPKHEVVLPAAKFQFKEVIPGVSRAVVWGDPSQGRYAALTKFKAGHKNALHSHASDMQIVVISGAYIYGTEKGEEKLGPGSYASVPGGRKHTSTAVEDTLIFEQSNGKFTLDMAQ